MENFTQLYNRAKERQKRAQLPHGDPEATKKRVKEAFKTMEELVLPQSPAEAAMMLALGPIGGKAFKGASLAAGALASPDAEAVFIGPKGIERLRKLKKDVETFPSRFFGERAELNPSDAANVWWRMGDPGYTLDRLLKQKKTDILLKDILPKEEFPELFEAYPGFAQMAVNLRPSEYQEFVAASYKPLKRAQNSRQTATRYLNRLKREYDRTAPPLELPNLEDYWRPDTLDYDWESYNKTLNSVVSQRDIARDQYPFNKLGVPIHEASPEDKFWLSSRDEDDDFRYVIDQMRLKKKRSRVPGTMTLNVPNQGIGDNPSLEFMNSILHELQHAIQDFEGPPGIQTLLDPYTRIDDDMYELLKSKTRERMNQTGKPEAYTNTAYLDRRSEGLKQNKGVISEEEELRFAINDTVVKNWLDSLSHKERKLVTPWLEDIWWPPNRNDMNRLRAKLYLESSDPLHADLIQQLDRLEPKYAIYTSRVNPQYVYKMNPYEREAVEAARRDTDPQYRSMYSRKTEDLNPYPWETE